MICQVDMLDLLVALSTLYLERGFAVSMFMAMGANDLYAVIS